MKCQRKPETHEKCRQVGPAPSPVIYESGLRYSSQRSFFNYSSIDTGPVSYELDSNPVCGNYSVSIQCGLPEKMDFTMKKPDAYLRSKGRYSDSSELLN